MFIPDSTTVIFHFLQIQVFSNKCLQTVQTALACTLTKTPKHQHKSCSQITVLTISPAAYVTASEYLLQRLTYNGFLWALRTSPYYKYDYCSIPQSNR